MIILKYGKVKQMNKKSPRRKHKCSNCGCKVLLEEEISENGGKCDENS